MARSLGYLDWANQPDPFRRYDGTPVVDLVAPLADASRDREWAARSYDTLFDTSAGEHLAAGLPAVSVFLRYSLGLSAWKAASGSRWALRVNPSSGNLHPTEGYVILPPGVAGAEAGVWHYRPDVHALERRCLFAAAAWSRVTPRLPRGAFVAALSSIHWREAWKYGERAFRYCQHDTGHALAAMSIAAAMMGWHAQVLTGWSAASLATTLGLDRDADYGAADREEPECVLLVSPEPVGYVVAAPCPAGLQPCATTDGGPPPLITGPVDPLALASACAGGAWSGTANALSADRITWEAIDDVAEATRADGTVRAELRLGRHVSPGDAAAGRPGGDAPPASRILLQRRSAVAMAGEGELSLDAFCVLLRRLLPGNVPPWDAWPHTPRLHLILFVHRVAGLTPGLYALPRTADGLDVMQRELRADFAWIHIRGVPDDLPLYLLAPADVRQVAAALSCQQTIASGGCFAVAMLAEFDAALDTGAPAAYRLLFREAGIIGHMLYLEAEAAGVRGTGIGCFFDDHVHDVLGIRTHALQSLYHFTVGHPVDDARLQTEPGYAWERARQG